MPLLPQDYASLVKKILEVDHGYDCVEDKANEVREGDVRDTIRCIRFVTYLSMIYREKVAYLSRRSDDPSSQYS